MTLSRLSVLLLMLLPAAPFAKAAPDNELPPLFAKPAHSQPAYRIVAEKLRSIRVQRGEFRQEKRIEALTRPLVSEGRFISAAERGLYWKVTSPFEAQTLFAPDGMYQRQDGSDWAPVFPEGREAVQGFVDVLQHVFAGDPSALEQDFEISFDGVLHEWQIGLVPKTRELKRFVRFLILKGGGWIEGVSIAETSGDTATIAFRNVRLDPRALTEEEKACFAH